MKHFLIKIKMKVGDYTDLYYLDDLDDYKNNINIIKILDLDDKQALYYQNMISVYNASYKHNQDEIYIYKLIPENQFLDESLNDMQIPESGVIKCVTTPLHSIKGQLEYGLSISINSLIDIKNEICQSKLRLLNPLKENIDEIDKHSYLYYHPAVKNGTNFFKQHYLLFFNVELKKILSEISYKEFEKSIKDKLKKLILIYLHDYCNDSIDIMNAKQACTFFYNENFVKI